jgi:hypothetical protein
MDENKKISYAVRMISDVRGVSDKARRHLLKFIKLAESKQDSASKRTHYDRLNEWSDEIYDFIHEALKKFGFVNGDPVKNSENPDASFWWGIYGMMSSLIYSRYLETKTANHHSSAYERNRALIMELYDLKREISLTEPEDIMEHIDSFTDMYENGKEINPIPEGVKVTGYYSDDEDEGFSVNLRKDEMGFEIFGISKWILHEKLEDLIYKPKSNLYES